MMIEKIITKNNQDFQYFSESELTELRNESFVRSYKKAKSFLSRRSEKSFDFIGFGCH